MGGEKKKEKLTRAEVIKQLKGIIDLFSKPIAKTKKIVEEDSLQAIINYLRVGVKYMLFDNEASSREIKKLLEDKEKK